MPRKILTVNECYSDNIGDQAIAHAMKRFCTLNADDDVDTCDFSFRNKLEESGRISSNKKTNWKRLIPVFIKKTFFAIKNVQKARNLAHKKYDLAIIGGGQLILSNSTFSISLFLYTLFLKIQGTKIKLVSVGVGKNFSLLDKLLFKLSFRYIDDIYVRDQQSALNLEANFSRKAKIIPDIAYFLPKVLPEVYKEQSAYMISPVEYSVFKRYYQEVGGVFLNEDEYIHNWIEAINDSMDKEKISKIYLAATTINDLNFTKVLFDRLKSYPNSQKNIQLIKNVDLDEYISLLHKCQSVLSGRMHALILGHSIGLKVLPYKISQKIESYQKEYLQYDADYFREKLIELRAEIL